MNKAPLSLQSRVATEPYPHVICTEVFEEVAFREFAYWLPNAPWRLAKHTFYEQWECVIERGRVPTPASLVLESVVVDSLRTQMELWFDVELDLECRICAHKLVPGQGIGPHTDNPSFGYETHRLIVSPNLSFSDYNGGHLLVLEGRAERDLRKVLRPMFNVGFAFEASERSFHAVSEVVASERYSLIFNFTHVGNSNKVVACVESILSDSETVELPTNTSAWQLLTKRGASSTGHSDRTFIDHLAGVYRILKAWRLSDDICMAGLTHSVYGTSVAPLVPLDERNQVIDAIGEYAERIVYRYCRRDNRVTDEPDDKIDAAIAHLRLANYIEQIPRCHFDSDYWSDERAYFISARELLSPRARLDAEIVFSLAEKTSSFRGEA